MEPRHAKVLTPAKFRHLLRVTEATSRFPERDTLIVLLGVTCGMRVTEIARLLSALQSTSTKHRGAALLHNLPTGTVISIPIENSADIGILGNVAEWIVEDPAVSKDGPLYPFPVYSDVTFTGCAASSRNIEALPGNGRAIDMVQVAGTTLSTGVIEGQTTVYCPTVRRPTVAAAHRSGNRDATCGFARPRRRRKRWGRCIHADPLPAFMAAYSPARVAANQSKLARRAKSLILFQAGQVRPVAHVLNVLTAIECRM
ncbi:G1 family glutamic endopeptidase [Paraburkholderia sp. BR14261]